jgi:hypothetical protein
MGSSSSNDALCDNGALCPKQQVVGSHSLLYCKVVASQPAVTARTSASMPARCIKTVV